MVTVWVIIVLCCDAPDDEDAPVQLPRPLSERVHAMVAVEGAVLLGVEVRGVVEILTLPLSHSEALLELFTEVSFLKLQQF